MAVRYPGLCQQRDGKWTLGSFATVGIPARPPGFQLVFGDTDTRISGLVAADMTAALCTDVLKGFPAQANDAHGVL